MNETISLLKNHGTVRAYDPNYQITKEELDNILSAAKQAPSWQNGQAYSITIFTGKEKNKLAKLIETDPNQGSNFEIINQSNIFLMFNINLSLYGIDADFDGEIEPLLIGTVDTALALENALIAAESLGLGTCVVGGIRRLSEEIITTHKYPKYSFPLVGLALGKPAKEKFVKPRLSDVNIFYAGESMEIEGTTQVESYGKILNDFSQKAGYTSSEWQTRFVNYYNQKQFPKGTKESLKKQGLI